MPAAGSPRRKKATTNRRTVSEDDLKAWAKACAEDDKRKPPRRVRPPKVRVDRYAFMRGAAKRFNGLSEELQLRIEMRNITCKKDGFLVQFSRDGQRFTRWFGGLADESLSAAIEFRDKAERIFGYDVRNAVPAQVLSLLGLRTRVRGIHRNPRDLSYGVIYKDAHGAARSRDFCFRHVAEEDAYASAIAFLEEQIAEGPRVFAKGAPAERSEP